MSGTAPPLSCRPALGLVLLLALLVACGAPPASGVDREAVDQALFELQMAPMDGRTPPPFRLENLAGGAPTTLAALRGRVVLLYFWASW